MLRLNFQTFTGGRSRQKVSDALFTGAFVTRWQKGRIHAGQRDQLAQQLFGTYPVGSIANANNPNPYLTAATVTEKEIGLEARTLNSRLCRSLAEPPC